MLATKLSVIAALLLGVSASPVHQPSKRGLPRLGGVNLSGCEFGMKTDGSATSAYTQDHYGGSSYCPGTDQVWHFAQKGANLIRVPLAWQYVIAYREDSTYLDGDFFNKYDPIIQAGLQAGQYVMIDIHNYARWNGGIIGQGGPTDEQFANLWRSIAERYKDQPNIIFGIMNEPHEVPDNNRWAQTVQAAVNAIRGAGANSQTIALPGNFWSHPDDWLNWNNGPLLNVYDPATGDHSRLILDVHKYLDSDGSGTHTDCTTNAVDVWANFANFLRQQGRRALISEIGGGNTPSCWTALDQSLQYLVDNSDVYVGFAVWAAGSFWPNYELSIVPQNGNDNDLFNRAIQRHLPGI